MKQPNIVFFFADDLRHDAVHFTGNKDIITPNLDRLAAQGTAFLQAHIPSGSSPAICMPSRAMLLTGKTLFHLEGEGQHIPTGHITIGEALKNAGYRTFGAGKWHNGPSSYARSFTDGDAIFFGGMWDHWNVPMSDFDPSGAYDNAIPFTMNFRSSNKVEQVHCDRFTMGTHSTEAISDAAIRFIERYDDHRPFYMQLSYLAPHDPRTMPDQFRKLYDRDRISLPNNCMEEHPFRFGVEEIRDELLAPCPRTEQDIRAHMADYYAMISHLDDEIGRVMETLKKTGKDQNTIIIFAADNGLAVGQHGLMGKQNHYDHSIRVPLIFAGPGIPSNELRHQLVYLFDIFPTICEFVGIDIPESVESLNLAPAIYNPGAVTRDALYFAYTDLIRSVKTARYKLVEYACVKQTQLFDLVEDPWETTNLIDREDAAPIVDELRKTMQQLCEDWDDRTHPLGKSFWSNYERVRQIDS